MPGRRTILPLLALVVGLCAGCERPEEVSQYVQPKPDILRQRYFGAAGPAESDRPAERDRMFAAIVPHGSKYWFFKVVGGGDAIRPLSDEFARFIDSVTFKDDDSPPQWTLPKDWREIPSKSKEGFERFATIGIGRGEKPLELAVTSLPRQEGGDENSALLLNVNRWRGQLALAPIGRDQLEGAIRKRKATTSGETRYVLGLTGRYQPGGMTGAPLAGGPDMPEGHPPVGQPDGSDGRAPPINKAPAAANKEPTAAPLTAESGELKYEVPSGWQPGKAGGMRKAAFVVQDKDRSAEITIIPLSAQAADIGANVRRWLKQLKMTADDEPRITAAAKPIAVGDSTGKLIEILGPKEPGPQQAVLGVIVPRGNQTWSITLRGNAELAERERPRFEAFVKSIRFDSERSK